MFIHPSLQQLFFHKRDHLGIVSAEHLVTGLFIFQHIGIKICLFQRIQAVAVCKVNENPVRNHLKTAKIHTPDKEFVESHNLQVGVDCLPEIFMILFSVPVALDQKGTDHLKEPLIRFDLI